MNKRKKEAVRRQPRTGNKRQPVTIQLHSVNDADIVTWFEAIPMGQRQQVLKSALRQAMGSTPQRTDNDMLYQGLVDMKIYLDDQFDNLRRDMKKQIVVAPIASQTIEDKTTLDSQFVSATLASLKKGKSFK